MNDGPFTAIDHVQLAMPTGEEDAARRFFRDLLGMTEITKPTELAKRVDKGVSALSTRTGPTISIED